MHGIQQAQNKQYTRETSTIGAKTARKDDSAFQAQWSSLLECPSAPQACRSQHHFLFPFPHRLFWASLCVAQLISFLGGGCPSGITTSMRHKAGLKVKRCANTRQWNTHWCWDTGSKAKTNHQTSQSLHSERSKPHCFCGWFRNPCHMKNITPNVEEFASVKKWQDNRYTSASCF